MSTLPHDREASGPEASRKHASRAEINDAALKRLDRVETVWWTGTEILNRPRFMSGDDQLAFRAGRVTPTMIAEFQKANPDFPEIPRRIIVNILIKDRLHLKLRAAKTYYRWLRSPRREVKLQLEPHDLERPLDLERFIAERPHELAHGTKFKSSGRGGKRLVLRGNLLAKIRQEAQREEDWMRTEAARKAARDGRTKARTATQLTLHAAYTRQKGTSECAVD